jgi:hypothetical protein
MNYLRKKKKKRQSWHTLKKDRQRYETYVTYRYIISQQGRVSFLNLEGKYFKSEDLIHVKGFVKTERMCLHCSRKNNFFPKNINQINK